jgi:hypothetical protein
MAVYRIDPLHDCRWQTFLLKHPRASIFHTPGWLEALRRTYGYEALALTTSTPGEDLTDGLVLCGVNSRLTGRRIVSLPFSDHCEPLLDRSETLGQMLSAVRGDVEKQNLDYVEIRPASEDFAVSEDFARAGSFWLHKIDLRHSLEQIRRYFHKDCVLRKLRRAAREYVTCDDGRSDLHVAAFYRLLLMTRRRLGLPPQPLAWYRNLVDCLGDNVTISIAYNDGRAIAGMLTLRYKDVMVYKYGGSDAQYHRLGGMQLLFWRAIQRAKTDNIREFDLGRSDCNNVGLAQFKERWGAVKFPITYWRYPAAPMERYRRRWATTIASRVFAHAPNGLLTAASNLLYRHVG